MASSPMSYSQRSEIMSEETTCRAERLPDATLYSAMQRAETKVGGGEGLEGCYGSITRVGTRDVLDALRDHAGLGSSSVVLDIGSGLGRPLLHAIVHSNVAATFGIEVDAVKCQKAIPFIKHCVTEMMEHGIVIPKASQPKIICKPIEKIPSLEPATHIYAAWEGFAVVAMEAVGKLFSASSTAKAITIVQRSFRRQDPAEAMQELGFGLVKLVASIPVSMAGSSRRLNAYCFVRDPTPALDSEPSVLERLPDLSTLPAFQADQVISVLLSQATERSASRATPQAGEEEDDSATTKDRDRKGSQAGRGQQTGAPVAKGVSGTLSKTAGRGARSKEGAVGHKVEQDPGTKDASDKGQHGYGLRRRA